MFKNEIPQLLENVFDEITDENEIIRINTLHVDLGTLSGGNFKNEFKAQLAEQIKKAIIRKKAENVFGSNDIVVIKKEQSLQEVFKHFLQYGIKPWFSSIKTLQQWQTEILDNFSQQNWQNIGTWLKENLSIPVILERLINQFSDEVLIKILKELSSFNENEWGVIYNDLTALYNALSLQQNNIRANIWHDSFFTFLKQQLHESPLYLLVSTIFQQYRKSAGTTEYLNALNYISIILNRKEADKEDLSLPYEHNEQLRSLEEKIHSDVIRDAIKEVNEDAIKSTSAQSLAKTSEDAYAEAEPDNISNETNDDKLTTKEQDKKLKKKATDAIEGEIQYVINSGIVILHPFLQMYFDGSGLIKEKKFTNIDACKRAVLLLHFLATGETSIAEFDLLLQKIMCNLSLEETLPAVLEITGTEKEESEKLLLSVINYWPPLKNTSIAGLRNTFLQRDGKLEKKENGWRLTIEQRTVDILLDKLPWGFSTIQLPWMNEMLSVDWC
jgi:hypothetical protein